MAEPSILIGTVTCGKYVYCLDEFLAAVRGITYANCKLLVIDNSEDGMYAKKLEQNGIAVKRLPHHDEVRAMLVEGHNYLRSKALEEGFDYLFILDQDVIVPREILAALLSHNKKIITGLYYNVFDVPFETAGGIEKKKMLMPVLYKHGSAFTKVKILMPHEVADAKLLEVRQCGTGCLLIDREVLEKISFRFVEGNATFDDTWFCTDAIQAGFHIFCDTGMKCMHRILHKQIQKEVWQAKKMP